MGTDLAALQRLWKEKRGEADPPDLSSELLVQLGIVTEDLNRRWFERNSGRKVGAIQSRTFHPQYSWLAATLDGLLEEPRTVYEAKFMLPWSFSEEAAAAKYMPQLQHNMLAAGCSSSVLSIITGGGKWVEIAIPADPIYQTILLEAEKDFWNAVKTGAPPNVAGAEAPRPRLAAVRIVDMSSSNSWAEFAAQYRRTEASYRAHEEAKSQLKALMPEDAKEAIGHGVRAKRSKAGAISFDVLDLEAADA